MPAFGGKVVDGVFTVLKSSPQSWQSRRPMRFWMDPSRTSRVVEFPILLVLLGIACGSTLSAATVTRGPYLQMGTPTSIVVRWRTDSATDSFVRYGGSPG